MKNSKLTVFLLVLCFALWGLVNNMSDNLVPAFQRIFTMDQDRAVLVQVAFYGAYAVLALFTSILVEEFSFRTGILIGLAVYVCGALLYIPACIKQSFDFYFIGIFVVAGGCAILEASSNSCMLALGDAKSAIRRLNFAQAMNPVGSIVGIFIAQKAILAHLNPATVEERLQMTPEQLSPIVHSELTWICVPYVALCLVMLAIWVYFLRHPIETRLEAAPCVRAPFATRCMHVEDQRLATAGSHDAHGRSAFVQVVEHLFLLVVKLAVANECPDDVGFEFGGFERCAAFPCSAIRLAVGLIRFDVGGRFRLRLAEFFIAARVQLRYELAIGGIEAGLERRTCLSGRE